MTDNFINDGVTEHKFSVGVSAASGGDAEKTAVDLRPNKNPSNVP